MIEKIVRIRADAIFVAGKSVNLVIDDNTVSLKKDECTIIDKHTRVSVTSFKQHNETPYVEITIKGPIAKDYKQWIGTGDLLKVTLLQ